MILSEEAFNMIQSQLARAIARAEKAEAALESEKRCHALAKSFHDLAIADRNLADHKLAQSERAREKAEAALAAVAALHDEYDGPHTYCHECGGLTPCETRRAVRDEAAERWEKEQRYAESRGEW